VQAQSVVYVVCSPEEKHYTSNMLYKEYRCPSCNKLLFKGLLVDSEVEVKCRGCGQLHSIIGESKEKLLCFKEDCTGRKKITDAVREGRYSLAP
jgi:phage FluMu protein Com